MCVCVCVCLCAHVSVRVPVCMHMYFTKHFMVWKDEENIEGTRGTTCTLYNNFHPYLSPLL